MLVLIIVGVWLLCALITSVIFMYYWEQDDIEKVVMHLMCLLTGPFILMCAAVFYLGVVWGKAVEWIVRKFKKEKV